MNVARIQEIYDELAAMNVPLDQTPELGLDYFRERMFDVRRFSDMVTERLIEVNRELSITRRGLRAAEVARSIAQDSQQSKALRDEARDLTGCAEDLRFLESAIKVKQANLKQIGSDIRLIVGIVEQGLKYGGGEIQPPKTPAKGRVARPKPNKAPVAVDVPSVAPSLVSTAEGLLDVEAALHEVTPFTTAADPAPKATPVAVLADDALDIAKFLGS